MVRDSIGSVSRSEAHFRAQPVGIEGAFSRWGASSDSGTVAREPDFVLSRSVLCVTIYRIRRLPQARIVRGTIRAFVAADDFNVRPKPMNAALIDDLADDSNHPIPIIGTLDIEGVRKGGGADLVIVVAAPLRSDSRSRNRLVKKFEAYLSYIASTAFSANGGIPTPDNTSIIVYIHPDSDREMIGLIESCRGWIHDNHARLEIKTLANQLSHPTPASDTPPVEQEPRLRGRG